MSLPNLDDKQLAWVAKDAAGYIRSQREKHLAAAVPLTTEQRGQVSRFFRRATLDSVRVLQKEKVPNPPFYNDLYEMGFAEGSLPDFSKMAAITLVDVVLFHQEMTANVLFHELVHVVQYELLGLARFAERYVMGFLSGGSYEEIPLEMHAYALGGRFEADPAKGFSVIDEVQKLVSAGLY